MMIDCQKNPKNQANWEISYFKESRNVIVHESFKART